MKMSELNNNNLTFPENFIFATASSAYQIEGAWNEDGKGENIWDHITHVNPSYILDKANADVACDSYHRVEEDVKLIKDIGFPMYRFSVSWSRILPDGHVHGVNEKGVLYYNHLINSLLANNIEPMITMYHWDLPQKLQDIGGWTNPLMADYFGEYARILFQRFGDRVKWWLTLNQPLTIAMGYAGLSAPNINQPGFAEYLAGHVLLKAHAKAYRIYEKEFRQQQGGKMSIVVSGHFGVPLTPIGDEIITEQFNQFNLGWFLHPIFSGKGDYPFIMRKIIDMKSAEEGRTISRLPKFSEQEIQEIKGSADFVAINHYTSRLITRKVVTKNKPSFWNDTGAVSLLDNTWPRSASTWIRIFPHGFRSVLNWLKRECRNMPIFVTEQGVSDHVLIDDYARIHYYKTYLAELLKAIHEDGCNVIGYTAWSIMDNFEWDRGYSERFGLHYVNFTDPKRKRIPKASAYFFKKLLILRNLNVPD